MARAVLFVLALLPLTGCAMSERDECASPFPLVVRAYPMVTDPTRYEVHTTLFNCTGAPLALYDPCGAQDGLKPSLVIANETYWLAHETNGSAVRAADLVCYDHPVAPRHEAEPGAYIDQRYSWDGTYRPGGAAAQPVPPGDHQVIVRAGPHLATARIAVPW